MILRRAEIEGQIVDFEVDDGTADEIDCEGGALLPGLHDHHVHLFAMAAAARSVEVDDLGAADADLPPGEWIRAVGYHESIHGVIDRDVLDRLVPSRPVRVQHATGAMWVLNSAGLRAVGIDEPTGRLLGRDEWLRHRLGATPPDLAGVGAHLAAVGVTGVTDATPGLDERQCRGLPQRVNALGRSKVIVADHDPPAIDDLVAQIRDLRPRLVAFHCASRLGLVLALAALEVTGAQPGDRIEHGAVIPEDALDTVRRLGLTVVTQPSFVHERGDRYLDDVDADDRPYLWRCGSLLRSGIRVAGSSDVPHGPADPWGAIRAAVRRRTRAGRPIGPAEAITAREALDLFLAPLDDPGGPPRRVALDMPADLCVLRVPLAEALAAPDAEHVRFTVVGGQVV